MKRMHLVTTMPCILALLAACAVLPAPAPTGSDAAALQELLVGMERRSWEAWKSHDGAFFAAFLSDDHLDVNVAGRSDKATVVAGVLSPTCAVKSYAVSRFQLVAIDANTALLTYRAEQDTICGGFVVPSPVWVSSLYARRAGTWLNVLFQQTPTRP
ncbi:MAG: nuclear transport factor 2 family protein [Caldimonas sp.]